MSMGGPPGPWALMHSFRRDSSVTEKKLPPGTVKRIVRFAAPYRNSLIAFLVLVVVDSVIGAAIPWIYGDIVREIQKHSRGAVLALAGLLVLFAVFDALINLANRWFSARIGEGLIYDMRSAVFTHI